MTYAFVEIYNHNNKGLTPIEKRVTIENISRLSEFVSANFGEFRTNSCKTSGFLYIYSGIHQV